MQKSGKGSDRYESKGPEYHQRVREGYEHLVRSGQLTRIDGTQEPHEVLANILGLLGVSTCKRSKDS